MKLCVVVNPKAGSGRAGRRLGDISRALSRHGLDHEVVHTRGPGDAARCVDDARNAGVDCVAIVGGDGTLNEACQAYLDEHGVPRPGPDLALIPAGTGGDFRKTFGIPDDVDEAVRHLAGASRRPLDLGILQVTRDDGGSAIRAFLNITSFGIGGLTDRIVNESPKWMGGRVAFFLGTLRAMVVYRDAQVIVRVDGEDFLQAPIFNVAIANGRYFGGGMMIAPDADPADGQFDVVALADLPRAKVLALSRHIYDGSHIGARGVTVRRGSRVEARPVRDEVVLIDMDGETPGRLPAVATIAPAALHIRA